MDYIRLAQERSLKPFEAESLRSVLYKPADWIVMEEPAEDFFRILARPMDGSSGVEFNGRATRIGNQTRYGFWPNSGN